MAGVANICDYVKTNLKTFEECPLNRVDSLVFSWLSYFCFPEEAVGTRTAEGLAIKDLFRSDWFAAMIGPVFDAESSFNLLLYAAASPRFRDVRVCGYLEDIDEAIDQQFSATTFRISDEVTYVGFRGTDNTVVGWKEDLSMAYAEEVSSQRTAVSYLERVASVTKGPIFCGGHSKGGNLAVYAAVTAPDDVCDRVVCAFSHDGPGFSERTLASERWKSSRVKIDKTIPQSSVIGMVFESLEADCTIVYSDAVGFLQHNPFSWEVRGLDFVEVDGLAGAATRFERSLNAYLAESTPEERARIVEAVFSVFEAPGHRAFMDLMTNWKETVPEMLSALSKISPEERDIVISAICKILGNMLPSADEIVSFFLTEGDE